MTDGHSKKRVAIFISGRGSNMQSLIDDMQNDTSHPGKPELVISNNKEAKGLDFSKDRNVETIILPSNGKKKQKRFEIDALEILEKRKIDLICLAGFMNILSSFFINSFGKKILNIHPSILPSFKGLNTHERAIKYGSIIHGATVHGITERLDEGPIFGQVIISVPKGVNSKVLSNLLLPYEHLLYKKVLREQLIKNGDRVLLIEERLNT